MAADIEAVNRTVSNYVADVKSTMPVDRAFLFGSYAKGTADEGSDIDVCFFMPSFGGKRRVDVIRDLLGITSKYKGAFFEPIAFPTGEIERGNPFVKEILRTGVEL
ncbi:MAG: nucleotidyltransferase domain-containing protein [Oscillospiraceae bacterium]|nr:nucleotidyltransferase domain-containing protein [Oscillospiraceae bacterium]